MMSRIRKKVRIECQRAVQAISVNHSKPKNGNLHAGHTIGLHHRWLNIRARKNEANAVDKQVNKRHWTASALRSDTGLFGKGQKISTNKKASSQKYMPISHLRPPKITFPPYCWAWGSPTNNRSRTVSQTAMSAMKAKGERQIETIVANN
jgi:hypothetical protein